MNALKRITKVVLLTAGVLGFGGSSVWAGEFVLKSGLPSGFNWTEGSSYEGGVAPGTADTIVIPKGVTATLSWTAADHASFDFVSERARVTPLGTFAIDVEEGGTPAFGAAVSLRGKTEDDVGAGLLQKTGEGEVWMTARGLTETAYGVTTDYSYDVNFLVGAGRVVLPQDLPQNSTVYPVRNVNLAASGTLKCPWGGQARKCISLRVDGGLEGAGTLEAVSATDAAESLVIYKSSGYSLFSGKLSGGMSFQIQNGSIDFTGTESSIVSTDYKNGNISVNSQTDHTNVVGFASFNNPGSFGGALYLGSGSDAYAHVRYLGQGETTAQSIAVRQTKLGQVALDGGESGGLVVNGNVSSTVTEKGFQTRLVLTGDHVTPCELDGYLYNGGNLSDGSTFYVEKRGTGTWKFGRHLTYAQATLNQNRGLYAVCDGTLQVYSVGEKGDIFNSLGQGTETYEYHDGTVTNDAYKTAYSVRIGSTNAADVACDPKFQYVGPEAAVVRTRPFGIANKGTILQGTAAIDWTGVAPIGKDDATLVLDGTDTTGKNTLRGVTDNAAGGKLSVVKKGTGTWTLDDEASLSGRVSVNEGRLAFHADTGAAPYRYYRLTIRETAKNAARFDEKQEKGSSSPYTWAMQRCGLFDDDGNWLCADFTYNADCTALQPGEVAWEDPAVLNSAADASKLATYFKSGTGNQLFTINSGRGTLAYANTNAHPRIVMRLRDQDVGKATRFNMLYVEQTTTSFNWKTEITAYTLEASTDGIHWQIVDDRMLSTDEVDNAKNYWWVQDHYAYNSAVGGGSFVASERKGKGWEIATDSTPAATHVKMLDNAAIAVAEGATIEATGGNATVGKLAIDCADGVGIGLFKGVTLAAKGTLYLDNAPAKGAFTVPLSAANGLNVEVLSDWKVVINGKERSGYSVTVRDDSVEILPSGLVLIFR